MHIIKMKFDGEPIVVAMTNNTKETVAAFAEHLSFTKNRPISADEIEWYHGRPQQMPTFQIKNVEE